MIPFKGLAEGTESPYLPLQLGVGGIFALLVIREVFSFLDRRKGSRPTNGAIRIDLDLAARQLNDLWVWHSKEDDDGVKVWYLRRSLETAVNKLAKNVDLQTAVLQQLHADHVDTDKRLERIEAHLTKE